MTEMTEEQKRGRAMIKSVTCHIECAFHWKGEDKPSKDFKQCHSTVRIPFWEDHFSHFQRDGKQMGNRKNHYEASTMVQCTV